MLEYTAGMINPWMVIGHHCRRIVTIDGNYILSIVCLSLYMLASYLNNIRISSKEIYLLGFMGGWCSLVAGYLCTTLYPLVSRHRQISVERHLGSTYHSQPFFNIALILGALVNDFFLDCI